MSSANIVVTIPDAISLALQHQKAGRLQEAEQIYRQVLAVDPHEKDAWQLLGVMAHEVGQQEIAIEYIGRAIALDGEISIFHNNLGEAYRALGRFSEAIECYRRALELDGDDADAYNNLGIVFQNQGKLDEAIECYHQAIKLKPNFPQVHNNLGNIFNVCGKTNEAAVCWQRALELKPDYVDAHYNLGIAYDVLGKVHESMACCVRTLELKPNHFEAYNNLGNSLHHLGRLDEAIVAYQQALKWKPDYSVALSNLGNALKDQGNLDESFACYNRALELKPDFFEAHSNFLLALHYCPGVTPAELAEAHAEFDRRHAMPIRSSIARFKFAARHPEKLRLGFVSSDLGRHPVGYFLAPVFENLRESSLETICYSNRVIKDDMTRRLEADTTAWRDVNGLSDEQLAEQIHADRIDILFDLSGHTAGNRILLFVRKLAPIQITWAGYVGTTGLKEMDYLIADHFHVPPGAEKFCSERVLYMPNDYVCYAPPDYAPPVAPLAARHPGEVTFGCFSNPGKVTPQAIEVWAKILRRLPKARLILKYKGWDNPDVSQRFADMFCVHGVELHRVEFLGVSPHAELLAEYNRTDLALDTFPYSGGLTTLEALWMGVPVITSPGETFASRHAFSHLSNAGVTDTIARDFDQYVELAVELANDLPRLAKLRAGLRPQMATSPICDGKRFTADFASLLKDVWEQWIRHENRL